MATIFLIGLLLVIIFTCWQECLFCGNVLKKKGNNDFLPQKLPGRKKSTKFSSASWDSHDFEISSPISFEEGCEPFHLGTIEKGQFFSHFEDLRVIGTGAFSTVKLLRFKQDSNLYAAKILNTKAIDIKKEIAVYRKLMNNLYFPKFYGSFSLRAEKILEQGMMLEFINGMTFAEFLSSSAYQVDWAAFYAAEIVVTLEYLHSRCIVYRDLKAENIMLAPDGHVKIVDLGMAIILKSLSSSMHSLAGSNEYVAPEVSSRHYNYKIDFYSFGILLYMMCSKNVKTKKITRDIFTASKIQEKIECKNARLLISKLCSPVKFRLTDVQQIKGDPFFANINWENAEKRIGSVPFVPGS